MAGRMESLVRVLRNLAKQSKSFNGSYQKDSASLSQPKRIDDKNTISEQYLKSRKLYTFDGSKYQVLTVQWTLRDCAQRPRLLSRGGGLLLSFLSLPFAVKGEGKL